VALDGAVLSIDNGANRTAYGDGTTPRGVFEGRAPQAPSAAIVGFRDALEEATALARQARGRKPMAAPAAAPTPEGVQVQPLASDNPATTTPLEPVPAAAGKP